VPELGGRKGAIVRRQKRRQSWEAEKVSESGSRKDTPDYEGRKGARVHRQKRHQSPRDRKGTSLRSK
jgi:hypothetical protein